MGRYLAGARVLLAGASCREGVGDTRYSGSKLVLRKLAEMGTEVSVHDPYVHHRYELESQDTYPATGRSWAKFFRIQQDLVNIRAQEDLPAAPKGVEALILAVRHKPQLKPDEVVKWASRPIAVVDCFGILEGTEITRYFVLACEVKALGRGHIQRRKEKVRSARA
jgi:UDP-N-acetyl-D-mannosaminuronate dehydrogenase